MAFGSYEVGVIQRTPIPRLTEEEILNLAMAARRFWHLKRTLDSVVETSHAFVLPSALRSRIGHFDPSAIEAELEQIREKVDEASFALYGFSASDRVAAANPNTEALGRDELRMADSDDSPSSPADTRTELLSWSAGVVFGRFEHRLAMGQTTAQIEVEPFDSLPAKSPGMLPDGAEPFHHHSGVLVDDPGHVHDIPRLMEEVLAQVTLPVPTDVRSWLKREFFPFHLQSYSKSRRKAPIYWPLTTTTGSYTLWLYYPKVSAQTLYVAVNDFIEPKLEQVSLDTSRLRDKGSLRTRDDEKQFELLQAFELEIIELRDALLNLAPTYKPNQDDGVQICAAPLWPLFRHKPWQKILKETWTKLEKGDYDWAHMAMNYWPSRVREKCRSNESTAIAHGLEHLYAEPAARSERQGIKMAGDSE